jgi:aspartate 1-decarboxylase
MELTLLKAKIHRATVTQADLDYVGSITIDSNLLAESGIMEYEMVAIADIDNGSRFETYVIAGEAGSGIICLNGAAAKCVNVGDKVIIMAYAQMTPEEAKTHKPTVLFVDDGNKIVRKANYEKHGLLVEQ